MAEVTDPQPTGDEVKPPQSGDDPGQTQPGSEPTPSAGDSPTADLPKWHYSLPGPLQGHESLKSFDTIGAAAERLVDLLGRAEKAVEVPGEGATLEERNLFYTKLGRPESPAGYGLTKPADWPNDAPWDEAEVQRIAEQMHVAGLSQNQAQKLFELNSKSTAALWKASQEARAKQKAAWREQLLASVSGDEEALAAKIGSAKKAFTVLGSPELAELLARAGIDENPLVVEAFGRAFKAVGEDSYFTAGQVAKTENDKARERINAHYPNSPELTGKK